MLGFLKKLKKNKDFYHPRLEVCISGSGGQGIILVGMILAEAIGIYEDKNVVQTQSYGPESRGGTSRCEVIASQGEILYPKTMELDVLLALNQEALDKNISRLKKSGTLIFDSFFVKKTPKGIKNTYALPFSQIANLELGNILAANIVALGALAIITKIVLVESLEQVLKKRIKEKFLELDNKALKLGITRAKALI